MASIPGVSAPFDVKPKGTKDDWYATRDRVAGGSDNTWSRRSDWGQGEELTVDTYDPNPPAKVGGALSQEALAKEQSYEQVMIESQALYGQTGGGSPQILVADYNGYNDTDGTWETDGITGPLTGSTPGSNPVGGGTQDVAKWSRQSVSLSDLAR